MTQAKGIVAHFLLHTVLTGSPPNHTLKLAYSEQGYEVEEFSPGAQPQDQQETVSYGYRWLVTNFWRPRWRRYAAFSCTSEDPVVIAGVLAFVWRKPLIFIADEIRSGSYAGNRSVTWKRLCRWAMRRAAVTIVNDRARVELQRDYAGLNQQQSVIVYPGCFLQPPKAFEQSAMRAVWGASEEEKIICFSGACNLSTGADLAISCLDNFKQLRMVTQPVDVDEMTRFLFARLNNSNRIFLQEERLSWNDAWASAGSADIGVAFYRNQAPQFQNMGISSNRLCMFLAMGVPVIANKQASFDFLHDYKCGIQVETQAEFNRAVETILADLETYKKNALICTEQYINTRDKYAELNRALEPVLG